MGYFLQIKNDLYQTKSFWKIKGWVESRPLFWLWRGLNWADTRGTAARSSVSILLPTLYSFIKASIYGTIIILILQASSRFYVSPFVLDKSAIDTLLTVIASVSGVFLGLYFTAISGIASSFLTRATPDVRQFFLSIPTGQQYIRTVAMTGIIAIFYIATKSLGYVINPLGIAFLALLAAYIIIRFWTVGSSVFDAMEPSSSMPWITRDAFNFIKGAAPPGFRWKTPVMQNHQRRRAAYQVTLIDNLLKFDVLEIKISDGELLTALRYVGGLLTAYRDQKQKIPTESLWYKTKVLSENWAFADSTRVLLAINTGTTLQPKTIKDLTWLEEQLDDIAIYILGLFLSERRDGGVNFASAFQGLETLVSVAEAYGSDLDEAAAKMLVNKVGRLNSIAYAIIPGQDESQKRKGQIAFVDSQGRLAIAILLGLLKYLDARSAASLSAAISKIDWGSKSSPYLTGLPSPVLGRIEALAAQLRSEQTIEGRRISPDWYVETQVAQQYLFSVGKYFSYVKSLHNDYFEKMLAHFLIQGSERWDLAVHVLQRWLEFSEKYGALIKIMRKHVEDCEQFKKIGDLPWPKIDFDEEECIALERAKDVVDRLVRLLPKLQTLVVGEEFPDYFGQALILGLRACYEACENNHPDRLRRIFPTVFAASLAAHKIVGEKVQNWDQEESKIIYSTEPLVNLFEISGYAKLYADLHENPALWSAVETIWTVYFAASDAEDARKIMRYFAAIVTYRDSVFKMMPRDDLRSDWQIQFSRKMEERGLPGFPVGSDHRRDRRAPTHPSALIRVIARWGGLMAFSARAVFFVTYLSTQPAAAGVEFPDNHDLRDQVRREEGRNDDRVEEDADL